jgi:hypothetical protein
MKSILYPALLLLQRAVATTADLEDAWNITFLDFNVTDSTLTADYLISSGQNYGVQFYERDCSSILDPNLLPYVDTIDTSAAPAGLDGLELEVTIDQAEIIDEGSIYGDDGEVSFCVRVYLNTTLEGGNITMVERKTIFDIVFSDTVDISGDIDLIAESAGEQSGGVTYDGEVDVFQCDDSFGSIDAPLSQSSILHVCLETVDDPERIVDDIIVFTLTQDGAADFPVIVGGDPADASYALKNCDSNGCRASIKPPTYFFTDVTKTIGVEGTVSIGASTSESRNDEREVAGFNLVVTIDEEDCNDAGGLVNFFRGLLP